VAADAAGYEEFDPSTASIWAGRGDRLAVPATYVLYRSWPVLGAGIYAIYFTAPPPMSCTPPRLIASPIYVGRAVPKGARKGLVEAEESRHSKTLWGRLDEHRDSIEQARNLDIAPSAAGGSWLTCCSCRWPND